MITLLLLFFKNAIYGNQYYDFNMIPMITEPPKQNNYKILFKPFMLKNIDYDNITKDPLNEYCKNDFEKYNANKCLNSHPNNYWCIYENCICPRTNKEEYIIIPIRYNEFRPLTRYYISTNNWYDY